MLEHELINELTAALEEIPNAAVTHVSIEPKKSQRSGPDAMLVLNLSGNDIDLVIETLRTAYPRDVREKIWQIRQYVSDGPLSKSGAIPMLVANSISKGARVQLKEANIGYYDASGSLFLPAPSMYVLVDRPPLAKNRKTSDAIFKGQRAQVLHYLFNDPDDWVSVKAIATRTGISTATVSETLTELERREWMKSEGNGPSKLRKLSARRDLLDAWSHFVSTQKTPEVERFYVPGTQIEEIMERIDSASKLADLSYAISGEAAVQVYSPYLSHISRVSCRMATGSKRHLALEVLKARPVSEGWNLAILPMIRKTETIRFEERAGLRIAPPLQVYLDLLQGGGRSKEMAQHLRETTLRV